MSRWLSIANWTRWVPSLNKHPDIHTWMSCLKPKSHLLSIMRIQTFYLLFFFSYWDANSPNDNFAFGHQQTYRTQTQDRFLDRSLLKFNQGNQRKTVKQKNGPCHPYSHHVSIIVADHSANLSLRKATLLAVQENCSHLDISILQLQKIPFSKAHGKKCSRINGHQLLLEHKKWCQVNPWVCLLDVHAVS